MRASLRRVVGRLNEARSHFGELFSGNYVFMQVNPAPVGKAFAAATAALILPPGITSRGSVDLKNTDQGRRLVHSHFAFSSKTIF
ncbi:unnamed protein product [Spirodela intermedia]|uniref:Uncharacterized protein n=1 Tax=Spirodela intermedia TaxID=51605 RepID=A0A7I8INY6_SPIIN|nr:unnamed protein product [Spirodela intermedia]CAA6659568.1 unnamed protein product [Spirodela intermedia]